MRFLASSASCGLAVVSCGLAAALLVACSGDRRDVVIETFTVYDARETAVRVDYTYEDEIALLVPEDHGYEVFDPDVVLGEVRFRGVPRGRYFIMYGHPGRAPLYVEASETRRTSHDSVVARQSTAASEGTSIALSASFVSPWVSTHQLEVFSERAYMDRRARASALQANAPVMDDVTATEWTIELDAMTDPYDMPTPLVDASEGDDLRLFVSEGIRPNSVRAFEDPWYWFAYRTITAELDATGTSFVDGDAASITGAFEAVPQQEVTLDVRTSAFQAALVEDAAGLPFTMMVVLEAHAEPALGDEILVGHGGRLFGTVGYPWSFDDGEGNLTHPPDIVQPITYGNPFGEGRVDMGGAYFYVYFSVADPVSGELEDLARSYTVYRRLTTLASGPIVPTISVPRNIAVGGQPVPLRAEGVVSGVGLTPRITWEAPAGGSVTEYSLTIYDTENDAETGAIGHDVARAVTRATSFVVPEGLLESGHHYAVWVEARVENGDFETTGAEVVSGFFSP